MTWKSLAVPFAAAALLAGCGVARDVGDPMAADGPSPGGDGPSAASCTGCHGTGTGVGLAAAAPADAAHLAHVVDAAIACGACHVVPGSAAHANGTRDVTFDGVATAKGATPSFSGGTCSGVYCHGGTGSTVSWTGGAVGCGSCHGNPPADHAAGSTTCSGCHPGTVKPDGTIDVAGGLHVNGFRNGPATGGGAGTYHAAGWSAPADHGSAAKQNLGSCQGCHGVSFDGGTSGVSCNACHGGAAWISNCTFCHGTKSATFGQADLAKAAPPRGAGGETATTDRAVGAHAKHLSGGTFGKAVACAECHAVPTDLAHLDGSAAVTFGAAAKRDGAQPVWNGTTCASTYCHGGTLAGGADSAPSWTGGAAEVACGSCHGLPPPAPHTSSTACAGCHGYDGASLDAARHLNGTVDRVATATNHVAGFAAKEQHGYQANRSGLASCKGCHGAALTGGAGPSCGSCHAGGGTAWATSCTFCHGSGTQAAPPVDTQGRTATTNVSVGLHAAHLGSAIMTAPACTECHASRGDVITDAAHVDGNGVAEVQLGTLARMGGAPAAYTRTSATAGTCASTYCHGRFTGGANAAGTQPAMSWTSTAQVGCTSCHGAPPATGEHRKHVADKRYACSVCHPGYTASTVNKATHLDGAKQVGGTSGWNATSRSCSNSCHGNERW
jgi:predicted CxxxxCH...CXXCH cytochrome family protein